MILQQSDGDHLVHTSGPLKGLPFTIKVDGQFGQSQDFFVFAEALIFDEDGASVIVGKKHALAGAHAMIFIPRNTWISATNTSTHVIHSTALFSRLGFDITCGQSGQSRASRHLRSARRIFLGCVLSAMPLIGTRQRVPIHPVLSTHELNRRELCECP
jgi:hypothetical protein